MLGYEYNYLFGLDLNLKKFGLGKIKQPKIIDFIEEDIDIDDFYVIFLTNDFMINRAENQESTKEYYDALGGLKFFIAMSTITNNSHYIDDLLKKISFLYGEKAILDENMDIRVGHICTITNDNFDKLCEVVLEMFKIDKSSIDFKKKSEDSSLSKEMIDAKRRFLERQKLKNKKKDDDNIGFIDVLNSLIHLCDVSYEKALNMTVYQVKNSYVAMNNKEISNVSLLHRISPKFESKKEDKLVLWTEKLKVDKSTLSQNG